MTGESEMGDGRNLTLFPLSVHGERVLGNRAQSAQTKGEVTTPECAVILVTYNAAAYLARCFDALRSQTYRDFEVIVVDNASGDDSLAVARAQSHELPRVTIIPLRTNTGFAAGNNQALKHLSEGARFVVLLNSDAFPDPDWLARLVEAAKQDPKVGMATSKVLDADPPHRIDSCGDTLNAFGAPCSRGRGQPASDYPTSDDVFCGCAAALLIRADVLRELGYLFDESLFAYNEDVDLAYRLQALGYRCRYVAEAVVHHLGSAASPGRDTWRHAISRRNMWVVFMRYNRSRPLKMLAFVCYFLAGDIKLMLTGRGGVVWSEYQMLLFGKRLRP